jgi:hypothetical protein
MKKTCTQIQDRLAGFVYGGLDRQTRTVVQEHLADCTQCRDQVRALEGERASLRRFVADLDAGLEDQLDGVRRRLRTEPALGRSGQSDGWQRFVWNRAVKVGAAAAVLLAGLLLLVQLGDGSMDLSNTALARVTEAVSNVSWVHLRTTLTMDGKTRHYESWLSNPLQIGGGKDADGRITWSEPAARRRAVYNPESKTVVISYASRTATGNFINPSSPIDAFRKQHDVGDTTVTCEPGRYDGTDVDIYEASHYAGQDGHRYVRSRHKLITDRDRHLILVSEQYDYRPDGTMSHSNKAVWDYPPEGPKSMYDIGVPQSARVLDFSPSPELLTVLDKYEANRDSFPGRYTAIVQYSRYDPTAKSYLIEGMDVLSSKGIYKRADCLSFQPISQAEFAARWGDSFETLIDWRKRQESGSVAVQQQRISLYDEEYAYSTSATSGGAWRPVQKWYSPPRKDRQLLQFGRQSFTYGDALAELAYPLRLVGRFYSEPTKMSLVQDDYAKNNACLGIELLYDGGIERDSSGDITSVVLPQQRLFYLDPNRDYFCRREEVRYDIDATWPVDPNWLACVSTSDRRNSRVFFDTAGQPDETVHDVRCAVVVRDVPEYEKMENGRWYPKKIVTRGHAERYDGTAVEQQSMTTILLNENPTFPEGTFDPRRLPK